MKRPPRKSLMQRRAQAMPPEVERETHEETLMPQQFVTGDTVMVKSGGPPMTVDMQLTEQTVRCVWFDGSREMASIFNVDVLRRIDMSKPDRVTLDYDTSEEGRE